MMAINTLSLRLAWRTPSPRRGEGWGEGVRTRIILHRRNPLTRIAARSDLSPQGRGEDEVAANEFAANSNLNTGMRFS
jgi:hypothetical protein